MPGARGAFAQVEKLLEQYGGMVVELEEAAALEARHADAAAWITEAQPILDADAPMTDAHTSTLEVRFCSQFRRVSTVRMICKWSVLMLKSRHAHSWFNAW